MSEDRVDPYLPGLDHDKTYDNIYFSDFPTMIHLLAQFQAANMPGWRKEKEETSADGQEFNLQLALSETRRYEVKPSSVAANIASGIRAYSGRAIRALASIPYELDCSFTLRKGHGHRVYLTMRVHELIDPRGTVSEFPLGSAYLAPSYLYVEGYFGAKLDDFLTSQLRPRA